MMRGRRTLRHAVGRVVPQAVGVNDPPLVEQAVGLDPSRHGGHVWRVPDSLAFAATVTAVPLALTEVLRAAAFLPLAIRAGDEPRPMVVLSSGGGGHSRSLIQGGRIAGRMVPAILRFYPFVPMLGASGWFLGGDLAGGWMRPGPPDQDWHPIFGSDGQLSSAAAERVQALTTWQTGRAAALNAARGLAQAGLLCPAPVLNDPNWLSVDPDRLMALRGQDLDRLNRDGALALGYALLTGACQMPRLLDQGRAAPPTAVADGAASGFIAAFAKAQGDAVGPGFPLKGPL